MNRLRYVADKDLVEAVESISPTQIDRVEFLKTGKHCPYCDALSGGGFTMNKKGQKLSVCMDCKGLFEFV